MKLYIVRHGETNYNVAGLYNAYPDDDVVLTRKGIADAKNVAEQLGGGWNLIAYLFRNSSALSKQLNWSDRNLNL